jgi:hypothetical protein
VAVRAPLQQDGTFTPIQRLKQRVILHAPRSDLHKVDVLGNQLDIFFAHHFGDDGQTSGFSRLAQKLEAETPMP